MLLHSIVLCLTLTAPALTQPAHDHAHTLHDVRQPASFADCIALILAQHSKMTAAIKSSDLDAAHDAGDQIGGLARYLAPLALKDQSIARDQIKPINLVGKDLVKAADELHHAAEDKNAAKAAEIAASMGALIDKLGAGGRTAQVWVCDMHCEGCKTYTAAGVCPVCKMDYKKIEEVGYAAVVTASSTIAPGKAADLAIKLLDPSGCPISEVLTVHEHPLHLVVVSNDLAWYAHEHPTQQKDGTFTLKTLAFPNPGKYTVFADFTPASGRGGGKNQVAPFAFTIPGDAPSSDFTLAENYDSIGRVDDYEFRIRCNGKKFFAGEDSFLRYGIDKGGNPVTDLEPLMGERGHLVIISADLKDYVHSHPMQKETGDHKHDDHADHDHAGHDHDGLFEKLEAVDFANGKPSDVTFHAVFPKPGLYRAFAQFKHKGRILMIPFTIDAQKLEGSPETPAKPDEHKGHDHNHEATK